MCNIQTAAKVSIFWMNLKEWWPFFATTWMNTLSTTPEILQESLGVELYCPFIYYYKIIWAPAQISVKNCRIRTTLFTHSLKAFVARRNTESSRSNSEKTWSLNLNFQHINGMISVSSLTAQLRKPLYASITPKMNWAGNSDPEVKEACVPSNLSQTCSTLQVHS